MNNSSQITTLLIIALAMVMSATPASATTEAEGTRAHAPMPHHSAGLGGTMVKAHFTRLDGFVEGRPDNASQLTRMKAEVQRCVRIHQGSGRATNPPHAWPDFVVSIRTDRYASANRNIAYHFGLAYGLRPDDCGLLETASATATLNSAMGSCTIDLLAKTATGVCDSLAHGSARPASPAPASTLADVEAMKKSPDNAGLAALAAVMHKYPPDGTGETKTVLGLECEVWKNPLDPTGTICLSTGGTFMASDSHGKKGQSTMNLETISVAGIKEHAVEAKLDAMVNSNVFAPYLAGGFTITNTAPRK
jgi:hypothetical protein